MAEPGAPEGQAAPADSSGTTAPAPQGDKGQSAKPSQATSHGSDGTAESFFDPKSIEDKPELVSAYKQMQGKFTKSMQKFKDGQKKVEAYDNFMSKPLETMKQLAEQLGYNLVQGKPDGKGSEDGTPKTWGDVYDRAKKEVLKELEPYLGEVQQLKQKNVEQYLDTNYSDWRTYEDDMLSVLNEHPTLAHDPDKLYRIAVPEEVWEARATKLAMQKLKGSSENGQISGANTTSRQNTSNELPKSGSSFNDFVAHAKAKLAREGLSP